MPVHIPDDPSRLLVAGDTHGNWLHWKHVLLPAAHEHRVGGIVQLGDFGYWPLTGEGRDYIKVLTGRLAKANLWVVFVDGNHEDHKALLQIPPRADGLVEITERILWAPRAYRWAWSGIRFLALGGAFSIDRRYRKLDSGRCGWFEEETITPAQQERAIAGGPADVLLTHDAPEVGMPKVKLSDIGRYAPEGVTNARRVQAVAEATKPKLLLHGHWHQFQQVPLPGQETEVIGLSMDGTDQSWLILDLPALEITHEPTSPPRLDLFADLPEVECGSGLTGYRVDDLERTLAPEQLADFAAWFHGHTGMLHPAEGPIIYRHDCERWLRRWVGGRAPT